MKLIKQFLLFFRWIGILWFLAITSVHAIYNTPASVHPSDYEKNWMHNVLQDIKQDFSDYLESDNLLILGDTFIAAGILANTGLDRSFRNHWQTDIRTGGLNNFFEIPRHIGGLSFYYVPIYLGTMGLGHMREHTALGNTVYHWGYRSLRTFILGGLQQVVMTNLLGSGRPCRFEDSKWQPFRYENGVSGHAFYGAVPFMTAAMMSDPPLLKYGLYALSLLPGISRVNSDSHYLSQVILGWTIALLSSKAVYNADLERSPTFQMNVYPRSEGAMLGAHLRF